MKRGGHVGAAVLLILASGPTHVTGSRQSLAVSIELGRSVAEVGVKGSNPVQSIHQIRELVVDRRHTLYVLEPDVNAVSVFSSSGRYLFSVGRPGRGKGEFVVPQSLTLDDRNRLYVYDVAQERVTQYQAGQDRLTLRTSRDVGLSGSSICAMRDHLYLFGLNHGRIVHELSLDGKVLSSFGDPFGDYTGLAQETLALGQILCIPQRNLILVVPHIYPEIRAYSPDGRLLWTTRLVNYRATTIRENADGSVTFSQPPIGYHHLLSAFGVSPAITCIQLGLVTGNNHLERIETRFISLRDGQQVAQQHGLPVLASPRPPLIYSVTGDASDRVKVYQFRYIEGPVQ